MAGEGTEPPGAAQEDWELHRILCGSQISALPRQHLVGIPRGCHRCPAEHLRHCCPDARYRSTQAVTEQAGGVKTGTGQDQPGKVPEYSGEETGRAKAHVDRLEGSPSVPGSLLPGSGELPGGGLRREPLTLGEVLGPLSERWAGGSGPLGGSSWPWGHQNVSPCWNSHLRPWAVLLVFGTEVICHTGFQSCLPGSSCVP